MYITHCTQGAAGTSSAAGAGDNVLNLLILGAEHLASDVVNEICLNCGDDGEYIYDGQPYYLQQRCVNGGDLAAFRQLDQLGGGGGVVCVYSGPQSMEFLRDALERSLLLELVEERFEAALPLVLVYQPEDQKDGAENELQRTEGQHLADMLHCLFIDTSLNFYHHRQSQHQNYIYDILNHLIECVRLKQQQQQQQMQMQMLEAGQVGEHDVEVDDQDVDDDDDDDELDVDDDEEETDDDDDVEDETDDDDDDVDDDANADDPAEQTQLQSQRRRSGHHRRHNWHSSRHPQHLQEVQPDIRIILCMHCGDPFSAEAVLAPILAEPTCRLTGERSVVFETFVAEQRRRVEVIVSSYHGANAFRDELVHGFILLYATKRRASLATLK